MFGYHKNRTMTKLRPDIDQTQINLTLRDRAPIRTLIDRGGGLLSPPLYLGNYYR